MDFKDDLKAWQAFQLTASTGQISQTAILMDLNLSRVSRLISGLEADLGYALFDKSRRPLVPTERGRLLLPALESALLEFRSLKEAVERGEGSVTTLRIAAPVEISLDFLCADYMRYAKENPQVEMQIEPECTEEDVLARRIDVALMNHTPDDASQFIIRPMASGSTFLMATPAYLEKNGVPKHIADLASHRGLLQKTRTYPVTQTLRNHGRMSAPLRWKSIFYTHDQLTIKKFVLAHKGIAVDLYPGHVLSELESGALVPLLPGWYREPNSLCLVTRRDTESRQPEVARFAQWWADLQTQKMQEAKSRELWVRQMALGTDATESDDGL